MALICNKRGEPKANLANAIETLRESGAWQNVLAFDAFAERSVLLSPPPWDAAMFNEWNKRPWKPIDDLLATEWMQRNEINVGVEITANAIETVAKDREIHPVRDYLDGLEWDGFPRIDNVMNTYFGARLSPYTESASRILFISAIARVMNPGCKADQIIILEGEQGTYKSTAIRKLFEPWMADEISDLGSKDAAIQCHGKWAIEMSELCSLTRGEIERVKSFITRQVDNFRPPYGRRSVEFPRQCIFIGTTNQDKYLKDETGNRRFIPIATGKIDIKAIEKDRDQLFAEAVVLYDSGAAWWIVNHRVEEEAKQEQKDRLIQDPWESLIKKYLSGNVYDLYGYGVSIGDILEHCLEVKKENRSQPYDNRIARIFRGFGLVRFHPSRNGVRDWRYQYPPGSPPGHLINDSDQYRSSSVDRHEDG